MTNWISVEDRLPRDFDRVDILINSTRRVVDAEYDSGSKTWSYWNNRIHDWKEIKNNVTHWLVIPEPPL